MSIQRKSGSTRRKWQWEKCLEINHTVKQVVGTFAGRAKAEAQCGALFNLNAPNLNSPLQKKILVMRVSLPSLLSRLTAGAWLPDRCCYSLDQPGPDSIARKWLKERRSMTGRRCKEKKVVRTCRWDSATLGFFQKSRLWSLSGREKAPRFLQTVNRLWLPATQKGRGYR